MDKKEALEIYLKVHEECLTNNYCKDCVFRDFYNGKDVCILDLLHSDSVAESVRAILNDMEEKQEEHSVPPKNVEVTTTFCAKAPISAEELEKRIKELLPQKLALELLPKEDRAIKMPVSSKPDNVNRPKHYCKGGLECIQVIKAQLTPEQYKGYLYGNVLKYMWRWPDKNGLEDLRKAAKYLEWLQEEVKKNG